MTAWLPLDGSFARDRYSGTNTIDVIHRKTSGWRWPAFTWSCMTVVGYISVCLVYPLGNLAT